MIAELTEFEQLAKTGDFLESIDGSGVIVFSGLDEPQSSPMEDLPWKKGGGFITLRDVESYLAKRLVEISENIVHCHFAAFSSAAEVDDRVSDAGIREVASRMVVIAKEANHLGLKMTMLQAARILTWLKENRKGDALTGLLEDLNRRFTDEMEGVQFFFVPGSRIEFYQGSKHLLGETAFDAFPSCRDEITEAGKCFTVGQFDASVFHLMRAMEPVLELLANSLGLTEKFNNWNRLLDQVGAEVKRQFPKSDDSKRIFFSGAESHLRAIKDAWRNPTMHSLAARYGEQEAKDLIHHVCSLLRHLASELRESAP